MATLRHHARINRSADDVWKVVRDAGGIDAWFTGVDACTLDGDTRTVSISGGIELGEAIITNDDALRRFQYSIVSGPMVPEHHLATIDVIEDGDASLVIYSCDVKPDEAGALLDGALAGGVAGLKAHLEP